MSTDHNATNYELRQHRRFNSRRRDCNYDEEFRRKEYRRSESLDRKLLMQKSESFEQHRADYRRNTSSSFDSLEIDTGSYHHQQHQQQHQHHQQQHHHHQHQHSGYPHGGGGPSPRSPKQPPTSPAGTTISNSNSTSPAPAVNNTGGSTQQNNSTGGSTGGTMTSCIGPAADLSGLVRRVRGMRVSVTPETSV